MEDLEALTDAGEVGEEVAEAAENLSLVLVKLEGRDFLLSVADEARSRLRELNELKTRHLGIAAHDLRNPLGAIRGLAKLALKADLSEEKRRSYLDSIVGISDEMLGLLESLLDVATIESGRFELSPTRGNLAALASARAERAATTAERKGIQVVPRIEPVPDTEFDAMRMGQVLDNLLSNAVKFSPSGSTVVLRCERRGDAIEIGVEDHGPGIPADELPGIFDAYQRSSNRPTGGEKSTGLGLSIVKPIVEAHGGSLEVTSTVGEGTTFTIRMPSTSVPLPS